MNTQLASYLAHNPPPPPSTGGASALADLTDVDVSTGLDDGDMLAYNANTLKWENGGVIQLDGPF